MITIRYRWCVQILLVFSLMVSLTTADTLTYQYDVDGRLSKTTKADDSSALTLTPTHNISYVMSVGDANTNGMPDSLEAWLSGQWSGSGDYNPLTCDSDGDGMCDMMEWLIGTDPFSYDSRFSAGFYASGGSGTNTPIDITISWSSNPNKTYSVESIPDIMGTNWTTIATNIVATPPNNSWTIKGVTNSGYFYRTIVEVSTNNAGGGE